nr:PilZ domain-containing protein [Thiocapsa imhoffii]
MFQTTAIESSPLSAPAGARPTPVPPGQDEDVVSPDPKDPSGHATSSPARRAQRRLRVQIPIKVITSGGKTEIEAVSQDISWGGVQFTAFVPVSQMAGRLRLVFPWTGGKSITFIADVVRAQQLDDGHAQVGVRFVSLSPSSHVRLEKLLRMLDDSKGPGAAADAVDKEELSRGLDLVVDEPGELHRVFEQVAQGRLQVSTRDAWPINQSLRLMIRGASQDLPSIQLRARVLTVEWRHLDSLREGPLCVLTLGFEHPRAMLKQASEVLSARLPPVEVKSEASPDAHFEDPIIPWESAHIPLAEPSHGLTDGPLTDPSPRSVLEKRYTSRLRLLCLAWGDPETFDSQFKELTLGALAVPGGWPPDAWEELGFLQDVHDTAYGLSEFRKSPLRPPRPR